MIPVKKTVDRNRNSATFRRTVTGFPVQGVTLIELMVVIAIMTAVSLLVIPQVRTISKERSLRETSRTVKAMIDEAVARARVDGFGGIVIARNPNIYRLVDSNGAVTDLSGNALVTTGSKVGYAGHVMYQMRRGQPFSGNTGADTAQVTLAGTNTFTATIDMPFDSRITIEPGSKIFLGGLPTGYKVTKVVPNAGQPANPPSQPLPKPPSYTLTCSYEKSFETPPNAGGTGVRFRILRRPEVIASSAVALPKGHFVNLNYSGALDVPRNPPLIPDLDNNDYTWTDLSQDFLPIDRTDVALGDTQYQAAHALDPVSFPRYVDPNTQPVMIVFGNNGSTEEVFPNGILVDSWVETLKGVNGQGYTNPNLYRTRYVPTAPLSFCISTDELENTFSVDNSTPGFEMPLSFSRAQRDLLNDSTVQWVTMDHITGAVTVADNAQVQGALVNPGPGNMAALQALRILNGRGFAANTWSAKD